MMNKESYKEAFKEIVHEGGPEEAWQKSGLTENEMEAMDRAIVETFLKDESDIDETAYLSAGIVIGICLERQRWRRDDDKKVDLPDPELPEL